MRYRHDECNYFEAGPTVAVAAGAPGGRRLTLAAAENPRSTYADLMLSAAEEIKRLRVLREEDGRVMSALIEGYQRIQAVCIDGVTK